MTNPSTYRARRPKRDTALIAIAATCALALAAMGAAYLFGWHLGGTPTARESSNSGNKPAASVAVDLRAELATFITQRAIGQGKEAGALILTSGIKSVDRKGTEWTIVAEFDTLIIAAEAPKQVAYLVGKYDPTATKVTVRTPGGQELYAGKPPDKPISEES